MNNNKSNAEKVLEFAINNGRINYCQLYCDALEANGKLLCDVKDNWTLGDVVEEILLAYEKDSILRLEKVWLR